MFLTRHPVARKVLLYFALLFIFFVRFRYGQTKYSGQDEIQIYLIGLKYYTTGIFPYWGADAGGTESHIPGGLQGLLVGLPFFCCPVAESPYFLLNALSFAAILYFGWYLTKRVPEDIPVWFIYAWLFSAPWLMHYSTHIENPSYVLFGAVLFFIGVFELLPLYPKKILPPALSFFQIGFALCWIMQLHLSWVLLFPFIAGAFYFGCGSRRQYLNGAISFISGAALTAAPLLPVILRYGDRFSGGVEQNVRFHPENLLECYTVFARFLSFACYELPRFIGHNTASRIDFLTRVPWSVPFAGILFVAGIAQFIWLTLSFFTRRVFPEWRPVKLLTLFSILITCGSFCFSTTTPSSHAYYLLLPVAMWYSFYCYSGFWDKKYATPLVLFALLCGVFFHVALALDNDRRIGLHNDREKICYALEQRDYTFAGLRREGKFERKHMENTWKTDTASDGTVRYSNNLEYDAPYFKPQNIVANEHHSGLFSCKIDSIQPYSAGFEAVVSDLRKAKTLRLSCFIKTKTPSDLKLVEDIRQESRIVHWTGRPALENIQANGQWQKAAFTVNIPSNVYPSARLFLYFWLPSKNAAVTYIDGLQIEPRQPETR